MSNLPPGVTGNEYQIAGPDVERDEERECSMEGVAVRTISGFGRRNIDKVIESLANARTDETIEEIQHRVAVALMDLRYVRSEIEETDVDTCPFKGMVTVQGYRGVLTWECPVCRSEHEEEVDPDDDPNL